MLWVARRLNSTGVLHGKHVLHGSEYYRCTTRPVLPLLKPCCSRCAGALASSYTTRIKYYPCTTRPVLPLSKPCGSRDAEALAGHVLHGQCIPSQSLVALGMQKRWQGRVLHGSKYYMCSTRQVLPLPKSCSSRDKEALARSCTTRKACTCTTWQEHPLSKSSVPRDTDASAKACTTRRVLPFSNACDSKGTELQQGHVLHGIKYYTCTTRTVLPLLKPCASKNAEAWQGHVLQEICTTQKHVLHGKHALHSSKAMYYIVISHHSCM